jgi:hypothetical protein
VGGSTIQETGSYWDATDRETRLWQEQIANDPPDPEKRSFLGPAQRALMFPPPYVIHDRGLPPIAGEPAPEEPEDPEPAWFVPASLERLRAEVDARWPGRDTSSDGTIGDTAHSTSQSEHNPVGHEHGPMFGTPGAVHAMDITTADIDAELVIGEWLLRDPRVWYVIHKGRIWSKTYDWVENPYAGDPHDQHLHVSLRADDQADAVRAETDVSPWEKPGPPGPGPGRPGVVSVLARFAEEWPLWFALYVVLVAAGVTVDWLAGI